MATKNTSILLAVLLSGAVLQGCASKASTLQQSTDQQQRAMGLVPCDTDMDCQEKNGDPDSAAEPVEYCEAITKAGKRCSRKVPEAGLLCKQHSKMVKAGKVVKTIE